METAIAKAVLLLAPLLLAGNSPEVLWEIGRFDRSAQEFLHGPDGWRKYREDPEFFVDRSNSFDHWPYVHPGPNDSWAGSRPHTFTIHFDLAAPPEADLHFVIDVLDPHSRSAPNLLVLLNSTKLCAYRMPLGGSDPTIHGDPKEAKPHRLVIPFPVRSLHSGRNTIRLRNTHGSWIIYDRLALVSGDPSSLIIDPLSAEYLRRQRELFTGEETYPGQIVRLAQMPDREVVGLAWDGEALWCGSAWKRHLFRFDPMTGKALLAVPSPATRPGGLDWCDGKLYQHDLETNTLFAIDPATGESARVLALGEEPFTSVAVRDGRILLGHATEPVVRSYSLTRARGYEEKPATVRSGVTLSHDRHYFWFGSESRGDLYAVDPGSWAVVARIPTPIPGTAGLAASDDLLWVLERGTGLLWGIRKHGDRSWFMPHPCPRTYLRATAYTNESGKVLKEIAVTETLPLLRPNQAFPPQAVFFSSARGKLTDHAPGRTRARFRVPSLAPNEAIGFGCAVPMLHGTVRYVVYPHQVKSPRSAPKEIRKLYLGADKDTLSMDSPVVRKAAAGIARSEKNSYRLLIAIHDYLMDTLRHAKPAWNPVERTISGGTGHHIDYSRALISLCRLRGLPARLVMGEGRYSAEVWLPGPDIWFPVEPVRNDGDTAVLTKRRHRFGSRIHFIDRIDFTPEGNEWEPRVGGKAGGGIEVDSYVRIVDAWEANLPPVVAGFRDNPTYDGRVLRFTMHEAHDREGDEVAFEVHLLPKWNSRPGKAEPVTITTLEAEIPMPEERIRANPFVLVVPVDGHEHNERTWNSWGSVPKKKVKLVGPARD